MNIDQIKAHNAERWAAMQITPGREREVSMVAARLVSSKERYQAIEEATGVPWFVIAVIHEREAGQDFTKQLGQGDPLNQVSRHVPRGRGPFLNHPDDPPGQDAFYRGAVDALANCPPYAARWHDWTAGGTLTLLEEYNGLGYEAHGEPSPYDWGATNQQRPGKYTGDGVYNSHVWDTQIGCAAMLKAMMNLDPSIAFTPRPVQPLDR